VKSSGRTSRRIFLWGLGTLALALAACSSNEAPLPGPAAAQPVDTSSELPAPAEVAAVVEEVPAEEVETDQCLECHTDRQRLIRTAAPEEPTASEGPGEGHWGEAISLEPWEKVLVDGAIYPGTVHAMVGCTECHGGQQSPEKEIAHTGLIARPSADAEATCGQCHPNIVMVEDTSLHNTLAGFWTALDERSTGASRGQLAEAFDNHCYGCHTTCGDCHVSQPGAVGGGFVNGHVFSARPSMIQNCVACHGSRIGSEYLGQHEGLAADVHFRQGLMTCVDCHSGQQMHGQPDQCQDCHLGPSEVAAPPADHRYAGVQSPRCETCHVIAATGQDGLETHQLHGGILSCQVCHSLAYTSCDGCHVAINETTGDPIFAAEGSYLSFLIGRNTQRSADRPYEYVPVRHVPIARDSFSYYGDNLLLRFNERPTWAYTTPHNIQRVTPQAASCHNCHGNAELFLTADKVAPDELEANRPVIVQSAPRPVIEILAPVTLSETGAITNTEIITPTTETP
jgi:hypothetical protein